MLRIVLYERFSDIYRLDYVASGHPFFIVAPDPETTDAVRTHIQDKIIEKQIEVFTFSKTIKELIREIDVSLLEQYQKKDLLLLICGAVYKKFIPNARIEGLLQNYELFTEIRGYSLNFDLIQDVLSEYDEEQKKAVTLFWQVLNEMKILDEHEACSMIGQNAQKIKTKNFIFCNFKFLNGVQVDFIQSLSQHHDVYIPYPKAVFAKRHPHDPISWLLSTNAERENQIIELKGDLNNENRSQNQGPNIFLYPHKKLGDVLKKLKKVDGNVDFFLGTMDLTFELINELTAVDLFFKYPSDFYSELVLTQFYKVKNQFWGRAKDQNIGIRLVEFEESLKKSIQDHVQKKEHKLIKVAMLFYKSFKQWKELSDSVDVIDGYDWTLIKKIVQLNLTRIYQIAINPMQSYGYGEISSIDHAIFYNPNHVNVVCLDGSYNLSLPSNVKAEKVLNKLAMIAPILRQENYVELIKSYIGELSYNSRNVILIEKHLEDKDIKWYQLLNEFLSKNSLINLNLSSSDSGGSGRDVKSILSKSSASDFLVKEIKNSGLKKISASMLQNYIDCPRKFYINYIRRMNIDFEYSWELSPLDLGRIEHLIIQKYLLKFKKLSVRDHEQVTVDAFRDYIKSENKTVSSFDYDRSFIELKDHTYRALDTILKLLQAYPETTISCEFSLGLLPQQQGSPIAYSGFIDLLFEGPWGVGIIDLKRSEASIPSEKEFFDYSVVQLWFYLARLLHVSDSSRNERNALRFLGYLNLKNDLKNVIWGVDINEKEDFHKILSPKKNFTADEFHSKLQAYELMEEKIVETLVRDHSFVVSPRESDVCRYCSIKKICHKGIAI